MQSNFYIEIAIVLVAIITFILYLAWQIKKQGLKETVISLIIKAEDMYKKGANQEKMNYVIDKVIDLIPMPFNLFVTAESIEKFIQTIFDEIKKALDYVPKKGV